MRRSTEPARGAPGQQRRGVPKRRLFALRSLTTRRRLPPPAPLLPLGGHSPCEGRSGAVAAERRCRVLQQHRERRCCVLRLRLEAAYQLPARRSCRRCWQAIPCLPSAFRLACPAAPAGGAVACRPRPQNGDACVNERALVVQALLRPGRSRGRSAKASAPKPPRQILFDRLPKAIGPVARRLVKRVKLVKRSPVKLVKRSPPAQATPAARAGRLSRCAVCVPCLCCYIIVNYIVI